TFTDVMPTKLLDKLATQTEEYICKTHSMPTITKRRNYYFYELLNAYQQAAAQNYLIDNINKQKAIENLTIKPISTDFLAKVITYFDTKNKSLNYPQLVKFYKETAYSKAEKIIQTKFKMSYTTPTSIE
ncbi:16847_t:CDS:1, partial [Racocetra fulgida]